MVICVNVFEMRHVQVPVLLAWLACGIPACSCEDSGERPSVGKGGSAASGGGGGVDAGEPDAPISGTPCTVDEECEVDHICFNEFCVGDGMLRISLAFDVDSDFDLHVKTPLGGEISHEGDADGGVLDVDQCVDPCGVGPQVENIVFFAAPPAGTYTVWVENFDPRASGAFTIEVAGAATHAFSGSLPAIEDAASEQFTFSL
jgi:hypothetical protein